MKITTFIIDNINRRLPNLVNRILSAERDIVCLQELKADDGLPRMNITRRAQPGARIAGVSKLYRAGCTWRVTSLTHWRNGPVIANDPTPPPRSYSNKEIAILVPGRNTDPNVTSGTVSRHEPIDDAGATSRTGTGARITQSGNQVEVNMRDTNPHPSTPDARLLSDVELENVAGGKDASGTAGGGNVSVWSWMKGKMFGVEPSFFD